ncbi:MAG: LptF/LptG family permease [Bacteroidia bacterium]
MKKIYYLSLTTFIGPYIATFFIALFVLVMQFLWRYIDDLAGKGLEYDVIIELLIYASAHLIPMAVPISVLLSSIMTFGALSENNELLAFKTTGVSLLRIMTPLAIIVAGVSIGAFFFANNMVPQANLKFRSLLYSIKEQKPAMDIVEGVFYGGIEGFSIRVGDKDQETDELSDIIIYDKSEKRGNVMVTRAENGKMYITEDKRFLILDLFNGYRYHEMPEERGKANPTRPHTKLSFEKYKIRFDLSSFNFKRASETLWKNSTQMLNVKQLQHYIDTTYIKQERKIKYTQTYVMPYFSFKNDSLFSIDYEAADSIVVDSHYISYITMGSAPRPLIQRALSHARSIKGSLKSTSNEINYQTKRRISAKIEMHRKFTLSIACFILFFIGASLGAIIRKGGFGLPVVYAIVIFIVFYIVMIGCEKAAKQQAITPEMGMWLPVMFITPIALILTIRANRDAKMVNLGLIFQQIFSKREKSKAKSL